MWVFLSDPVKDGTWLVKGQDHEHMLGLGAGTTSHHEGGDGLGQRWQLQCGIGYLSRKGYVKTPRVVGRWKF